MVKFYLVPGVRNRKLYLVPNDSYEKFYLAVKELRVTANITFIFLEDIYLYSGVEVNKLKIKYMIPHVSQISLFNILVIES